MSAALEFQHVDILFARERGRAGDARIKAALAALDAGRTRGEIAKENGVVVGVADASLAVERGHKGLEIGGIERHGPWEVGGIGRHAARVRHDERYALAADLGGERE